MSRGKLMSLLMAWEPVLVLDGKLDLGSLLNTQSTKDLTPPTGSKISNDIGLSQFAAVFFF